MSKLRLVFDGGAREGNPGVGYGSFKIWVDDQLITHIPPTVYSQYMNNVEAEYKTLLVAITWICERFNEPDIDLIIEGDSDLVRKQIGEMHRQLSGRVTWKAWRCNFPYLLKYRDAIRSVLPFFKSVTYNYLNEKIVKQILGH